MHCHYSTPICPTHEHAVDALCPRPQLCPRLPTSIQRALLAALEQPEPVPATWATVALRIRNTLVQEVR